MQRLCAKLLVELKKPTPQKNASSTTNSNSGRHLYQSPDIEMITKVVAQVEDAANWRLTKRNIVSDTRSVCGGLQEYLCSISSSPEAR